MKKLWILIAILLAVVLVTVIVVTQIEKEPKEIKIGVLLPLTGAAANHGEDTRDGVKLALQELKDASNEVGKSISLIWEDTQSTPHGAVSAAQKLINVDKVPIIIGPISSSATLAVAPIAEKSKTVLFSPAASSPKISESGDYIFRNSLLAPPQGKKMANFCYKDLGIQEVAILYIDDDTGRGYYESFRKSYESLGGKVIHIDTYDKKGTDFRAQITKLKATGATAVYTPSVPSTLGYIIKQSAELDFKPVFLGNIGVEGQDLLVIAGELAEGVFYTSVLVKKDFKEKYNRTYKRKPRIAAPLGYDAFKIAILAMKKGGYTREGIKEALYGIKNYDGATGTASFDENGDAQKEAIIKTVRNGEFVALQ